MSQPPYPHPGGADTGDDRSAGSWQQDPSARPYPEWQPAPDAAASPTQGPYPGTPPYGQPLYGHPQYGQPPYGHPQYGQPPYGHPQYGPGSAATPPWGRGAATSGTTSTVAIVLAALAALVVAGLAVALIVGLGSDDYSDGGVSGGNSSVPAATSEPEGLGDEPELDEYAAECFDGDMEACDDLYWESPTDSAYELYGGTCAGRQPNADAFDVLCVDAFPPAS